MPKELPPTIEKSLESIGEILEDYVSAHMGMCLADSYGMPKDEAATLQLTNGDEIRNVFVRAYMPFGVIFEIEDPRPANSGEEIKIIGTRLLPWHRIDSIYVGG